MIVGDYFKGDNDESLKWVQHDAYGDLIGNIYRYAKERYLNSIKLIGIDTPLAKKVESVQSFDHRILQFPHDIIAAWYRHKNGQKGQLTLFPVDGSQEKHLLNGWTRFFHNTIREWSENYNVFVISSLKAVCYGNTAFGYLAEDQLVDTIATICCVGDWLREDLVKSIFDSEPKIILSEADVQIIVADYLFKTYLKKSPPKLTITKNPPQGIAAYNLPQKDCWYIVSGMNEEISCLDSPLRLICVSIKNPRVIYDEVVCGA